MANLKHELSILFYFSYISLFIILILIYTEVSKYTSIRASVAGWHVFQRASAWRVMGMQRAEQMGKNAGQICSVVHQAWNFFVVYAAKTRCFVQWKEANGSFKLQVRTNKKEKRPWEYDRWIGVIASIRLWKIIVLDVQRHKMQAFVFYFLWLGLYINKVVHWSRIGPDRPRPKLDWVSLSGPRTGPVQSRSRSDGLGWTQTGPTLDRVPI